MTVVARCLIERGKLPIKKVEEKPKRVQTARVSTCVGAVATRRNLSSKPTDKAEKRPESGSACMYLLAKARVDTESTVAEAALQICPYVVKVAQGGECIHSRTDDVIVHGNRAYISQANTNRC